LHDEPLRNRPASICASGDEFASSNHLVEALPYQDKTSPGRRWFVGYTLPRKEDLAQVHLQRQGFVTFVPRTLTTRRHARKIETIKAALFPRYLFIQLDLTRDRWRSVNGTMGMSHLVTFQDTPCPVPVDFVEELARLTRRDGVINFLPTLTPGDPVRVIAGQFVGQIGELLRVDPKGRVEVLLKLLSGAVRVNMARELLGSVS
jgi:transcription elongation factor/antiterminator RfaH